MPISSAIQNPVAGKRLPAVKYYGLLIFASVFFAIMIDCILPVIGIEAPSQLAAPGILWGLCLLCMSFALYCLYIDFMDKNPDWLFLGSILCLPWADFLNKALVDQGVNGYETGWLFILFIIPTLYYLLGRIKGLWKRVPAMPYFLFYTAVLLFYYAFFQYPLQDQNSMPGRFTIGFYFAYGQIYSISLCLLGFSLLEKQPRLVERLFNKLSLLVTANTFVIGLIAIVAYRFHCLTINDGPVQRAQSIFYHPSYLGNYMALTLLFLCGLILYRQPRNSSSGYKWLFPAFTILIGAIALFLSFSKSALIGFGIGLTCFFLLNLSINMIKRNWIPLLLLPLLLFGGIIIYQGYSGSNLIDKLTYRLADKGSLEWREKVSDYLMFETTPISSIVGHGMSAGKATMLRFERRSYYNPYDPTQYRTVVQVHNSYLSQWFDYGLAGLIPYFILIYLLILELCKLIGQTRPAASRPLHAALVALIVYFLVVSISDTVIEVLILPFWVLITTLYGVTRNLDSREFNVVTLSTNN